MNQVRKPPVVTLSTVLILGIFASGCTTSGYSGRMVRKADPTVSGRGKGYMSPTRQGIIRVSRGDTLYTLARDHGVALRGLMQANRLKPPYIIYPGQELRLPLSRYHVVGKGQTVYQIARHYDVDMGALVRINRIEPPYLVALGQRLRLPDSSIPKAVAAGRLASNGNEASARPAAPRRVSAASGFASRNNRAASTRQARWSRPDPAPMRNPPPRSGPKFLWPVRGKIILSFGPRAGGLHNDGINIAARKGASIRAAENGVVAYTGNQLQGFGNLVLVRHSGGWMSAYAHSSVILVKRGDVVKRGQVIARVGKTGNVRRPQLHFELRRGERAVDPTNHLIRVVFLMPGLRKFAAWSPATR